MNVSALGNQDRLLDMVLGAGLMVKFVLLILLLFSVISWAIIAYKIILIRRVEKETAVFYDLFWEKRQFSAIHAACRGFNSTPLKSLFTAVYNELTNTLKEETHKLCREDMDRFQRVLRKASAIEAAKLEYSVGFLATTGNTAPFIGLFGTVWGIMASFRSIGAKGAANLAVVAPGISEALIATAMGLLAAIPAVVGYNHILTRTHRVNEEMNNFSSDLLNIIEKQIGKKSGDH